LRRDARPVLVLLALGGLLPGLPPRAAEPLDAVPLASDARGRAYAHLMRAERALRRGQVGTALEEIEAARQNDPNSPELLSEAAELLTRFTGRVAEAERMARRALEIDPDHLQATRFLAELAADRVLGGGARDQALRDEAIRLHEKLAQQDTIAHPEVLQTLARLHLQAENAEEAERTLRRLVLERPGDRQAIQVLAQLLLKSDRGPAALEVLLDYAVSHPHEDEIMGWVEQLANSQGAWPAVVDFLSARAPATGGSVRLTRFYGEALLHVDRIPEAGQALETALAANPTDQRTRKNLGLAYRALGRLADAAALFTELARENPEHPWLRQLLAETLADQGDLDAAIAAYEAALDGTGARPDLGGQRDAIRRRLALLHISLDDLSAAEAVLVGLETPPEALTLEIRCRLALASKSWNQARAAARELAATGSTGLAALLLGQSYLGEQRWSKAGAEFAQAIEILGPYARVSVAVLYREAGKPAEGLRLLEDWKEAEPQLADARFHFGVYFYEIGRFADAERELREAFRLEPGHGRALNFLGYSLAERRIQLDEALEMIERALAEDAWNGAYLDSLGWVYFQMGRYEEARGPLERAARELPKDATVLEHLGDLYHALGDVEAALSAWTRALTAGPTDAEAVRGKILRRAPINEQLAAEDGRVSSKSSPR